MLCYSPEQRLSDGLHQLYQGPVSTLSSGSTSTEGNGILTPPHSATAPKSQLVLKFFQLLTENAVQMIKGISHLSVSATALQNY